MEEKLRVGVICATHGLRGEVKVFPTTDDPSRFKKIKEVYLVKNHAERLLTIKSVRFFKQYVMLSFAGFERIEDVEPIVKGELYVTRDNATPLGENEYYIADLIGMDVFDEEGALIGVVREVLQTGANDVYVIACPDRELLLPAIKECVQSVDTQGNRMVVHILEGL